MVLVVPVVRWVGLKMGTGGGAEETANASLRARLVLLCLEAAEVTRVSMVSRSFASMHDRLQRSLPLTCRVITSWRSFRSCRRVSVGSPQAALLSFCM